MFTEEQKEYMRKVIGLQLDFNNLSEDDYADIEDKVADRLEYCGFDKNYELTQEGLMCEAILDNLPT